ncbi:MAG: hypothetical protein SNH94_01345 [Rikenellaceae bacterium]
MVVANLPQRAKEENLVGALEIVKQAIKERSVSQNQISELSNTIKIMIDGKVEYADTPTKEEHGYDMLVNASGDILLMINSKPGEPNTPRLVYDGGEMALLYRSRESAFSLKNITEQGREALMKESVAEIIVVEIENDDVAREYKVPIRKVKSIKSIM